MSRKKAVKGKAANNSSPSAGGSPTGKSAGKAARSSPGIVQMNGVVHPSRPSISNSSEFYDIAFKVRHPGFRKGVHFRRFRRCNMHIQTIASMVNSCFKKRLFKISRCMHLVLVFSLFIFGGSTVWL